MINNIFIKASIRRGAAHQYDHVVVAHFDQHHRQSSNRP